MKNTPEWPWQMNSAENLGSYTNPELHHPHRPMPDPITGELKFDPEIVLKNAGKDLVISTFYSSTSLDPTLTWGKNRSANVAARLQINTAINQVIAIRGDQKAYAFTGAVSSGVPSTLTSDPSQFSGTVMTWDGTNYVEVFSDGTKVKYDKTIAGSAAKGIGLVEDASGNKHTYTYNGSNLLQSITVPGGSKVTFAYTANNQVNTIEDWSGRRWTMTYDASFRTTSEQTPLGCTTQYTYEGATNLVKTITDPRGFTTTYTYVSITPGDDNRVQTVKSGTATWTYTYSTAIPPLGGSSLQMPSGAITTYLLDSQARFANKLMPEGFTVTYGYDSNNRRVQEIMPYGEVVSLTLNDFSSPLVSVDPLGNRTTYTYDASNNLTEVLDALGNRQTMTYDGNRRMLTRKDQLGRVTSYTYDATGNLKSIQDPRGLRTTHSYNTLGNIVSTIYSDGSISTFSYDSLGRRTAAMDPLGRVTNQAYDVANHVISITNAMGEMRRFVYDSCFLQQEIDALGNRTTYTYDRFGKVTTIKNPLAFVTTYSYDNMGYQTEVQDAVGNRTTMVYNPAMQRIAIVDANNLRTTTLYDAGGRPEAMQNPLGFRTTTIYDARGPIASQDPLGRRTTQVYDALGRREATVSPLNNRTTTVYDAAGQTTATIDPLNARTTYSYDLNGNVVTTINAGGNISTVVYQTTSNRTSSNIDPLGNRTTYTYNAASEMTAVQNARGFITTTTYDNAGRTKTVRNALGNVTTLNYDLNGRQVSVMDPLGRVSTQVYDNAGQSVANISPSGIISTMVYDGAGRNTASIDPANNRWTTVYDATGKQLASVTPLNLRTSYTYDNASRMVGVTNPKNLVSTTVYDEANQTIASVNPLGDRTTYTYDNDGRRTEIINPANGRITMVYDSRGSMTAIANELNQRTTYTYNPVGTVATRRFANGDVTTYTYDANQQLVTRLYLDSDFDLFEYDEVGNVINCDSLKNNFETTIRSSYQYDALNQKEFQEDGTSAGPIGSTDYSYDAAGQRISVRPDGKSFTYTYDNDGRCSAVINLNSQITSLQYDARGNKTTISYSSGVVQTWSFDNNSRNTGSRAVKGASELQRFTYTYDANGNRTNVLDANGSNSTYTYDNKDRLTLDATSGTNAHTYTYTYDSRDNITLNTETGTSVTMAYDAASRMTTLTSGATVSTLTYDVNGNLLSIWKAGALQADMLYDWENRQWSHTSVDGDTWYLYNAFGKKARIANNFSPAIDQYISWDGEDIVGEMNGENDWKYAFATVDGQMISEIENLSGTPVVKDYLVDFLGSITARTSSTGTIIGTQQRYKPYGSLLSGTTTPNQFHWTGNTGSKYTGLIYSEQYNRARHYSSNTSQWTTRDPLWPHMLAYGYVVSNPIKWIDSSGLLPWDPTPPPKPGVVPSVFPPYGGGPTYLCNTPPPPLPDGPMACTKDWNAWIYYFCNCTARGQTTSENLCSILSLAYYEVCGKPTPGSTHFGPPDDGSVGLITPKPWPCPPSPPITYGGPPSAGHGGGPIHGRKGTTVNQYPFWFNQCFSRTTLESCHRCCETFGKINQGKYLIFQCQNACYDHIGAWGVGD